MNLLNVSLISIFEIVVTIALLLHIITGLGSIVLFWIPIFTKKGAKTHRKVGKIYVFLMWLVIFSGIILTINKFYEGETDAGIFLGFLVILATRPVWFGAAALKSKNVSYTRIKNIHILFKLALFAYGIFMLIYSISLKGQGIAPVMIAFSVLGLMAGIDAWRDYKDTSMNNNWLRNHFEGMLISGVAAYTGFIVIGGYEFLNEHMTGYWILIPWLLPSIIGIALIYFYRQKFQN
ncbi:MAG: hypothetical protein AB8G11_25225 [Saprospiraceae bacterium]